MIRECKHRKSPNCRRQNCLTARGILESKPFIKLAKRRYAQPDQKRQILLRDDYTCRYCGVTVTFRTSNMDHVQPYSKGGATKGKNLVTACKPCNTKKGNKTNWEPRPIGYWAKDFMLGSPRLNPGFLDF